MGRKKDKTFLELVKEQAVEIYLVIMLGLYPVFIVNGYADLVFKKWAMFKYASAIFIILSILFMLLQMMSHKKREKKKLLLTDCFVAGYTVCVIISYLGAVDKSTAFWGVDTWYTGFVMQLLLAGIYFGVSRGYAGLKYLKYLAAATGAAVSIILILQRFGLDVFGLYKGFGADIRLNFVTTLGQVTWTSGYLSILLAAGIGIYYLTEGKRHKIFWGICLWIGFAMEVLLNCDSGILSICGVLLLILWMSIGSKERILSFTEILMIGLSAVGAVGIFERIFADSMVPVDAVYMKIAQSKFIYLFLAIGAVFYLLIVKDKLRISSEKKVIRIFRGSFLGIIGISAVGAAALFVLHGKGYFAGSPTENYFRFTVWWGNSRGFIWRVGAAVFDDFNLYRKLFGCGPDCFTPYAYELMGAAINEFWHNQIVPNVHNEWFNAVINYGIIGGTAYLGIFISGAYCFMKKAAAERRNQAEVLGIGLAAAAYIVHNILCYQQIIATPVMFILLGLGAAILRSQDDGHTNSLFLK